MWALACCDNNGICVGYLNKDNEIEADNTKWTADNLLLFKKKADTNEICAQINMSHLLLPNGYPFRVTPVRA